DFTDAVSVIKSLQQPQGGSDTAAIISALGSFLAATNKGTGNSEIIALYQQMSQQQQASFDKQLELLRERLTDQPSFSDQLAQIVQVQNTLGKLSGKESEAMQSKRLELEHQRWAKSIDLDLEKRKSAGQVEMIKSLTGGLSRALENPVVRELDRSVGSKIGVTENPLR